MAHSVNQNDLNKQIEAFVRTQKENQRAYTPEQLQYVNRYTGSGGVKGATGVGVLYEFYTPLDIASAMYDLAYKYGYKRGARVLEPSCATGNLLRPAEHKGSYSHCVGFEINPISAEIARQNLPGATIYDGFFESAFLQPPLFRSKAKKSWLEPFDLVIGNPPYGIYQNKYSAHFDKEKHHTIEIFFFRKGLELLKNGGLLIYLVSQNFVRTGEKYQEAKKIMSEQAEVLEMFRLPKVFDSSEVPTDIIVFKKK